MAGVVPAAGTGNSTSARYVSPRICREPLCQRLTRAVQSEPQRDPDAESTESEGPRSTNSEDADTDHADTEDTGQDVPDSRSRDKAVCCFCDFWQF